MGFTKATKRRAKLRLALCGPTGSGKTYSALAIAQGLGQRIALIDTECGSASLYADKFGFDVLELESGHPEGYIEAIHEAERAGYDVVIIDSLSHAWMGKDGALELVDKAAKRSKSGNSYMAWREITPHHNKLVEAMLRVPADIIGTTVAHTWAAGDDHQLYIASGVNVVNTSSLAIADMNGNDLTVSIAGTVFAGYRTVLDGINNTFHVAEGGSYISADSSTGSFAFGDANSSGNNTYIIDGSVTALQTSGVVGRGNASINVTGEIAAGGNAVFMGLFGADGDSLINSGTIRGGMRDFDAAESSSPERFAHGVFIEGDDTRVINLAGGMITTMAENIAANEGPAGIEYQDDISGARLRNYGEVSSVYGYGVDMSTATNLTDTSFINFGVVQGSLGSLRGDNSQATTFVNRGLMDGDVIFGTGDDDFEDFILINHTASFLGIFNIGLGGGKGDADQTQQDQDGECEFHQGEATVRIVAVFFKFHGFIEDLGIKI